MKLLCDLLHKIQRFHLLVDENFVCSTELFLGEEGKQEEDSHSVKCLGINSVFRQAVLAQQNHGPLTTNCQEEKKNLNKCPSFSYPGLT